MTNEKVETRRRARRWSKKTVEHARGTGKVTPSYYEISNGKISRIHCPQLRIASDPLLQGDSPLAAC
jgi:hypothetical protein